MKNKCNLILAGVILAGITAAYATCYLDQVVLCFKSGDDIGNYNMTEPGAQPPSCTSFTADVYAVPNAYRFDTYSVSRGGKNEAAYTSYCDTYDSVVNEFGGASGGGFEVYFYDACTGNTYTTAWSVGSGYQFTVSTPSHYAVSSAICN